MKKLNQRKILSTAVSMFMALAVCNSIPVQASDIEIYKEAQPTVVTLMLLIDISGSMDYSSYGGGKACDNGTTSANNNDGAKKFAIEKLNPHADAPSYRRQWCEVTTSGVTTKYPDRITRVKDGIVDLLFGNEDEGIVALSDDKIIGFASLGWVRNPLLIDPTQTDGRLLWDGTQTTSPMRNQTNANKLQYNVTDAYKTERGGIDSDWENYGSIVVPANRLDATVTVNSITMTHRKYLAQQIANIAAITNTPTATSYAETVAYLLGQSTKGKSFSGFNFAHADSRNTDNYIAPASMTQTAAQKQCHGQGIYVLTDGDPHDTSASNIQALMKSALGSNGSSFTCNSVWNCVSKLSKDQLITQDPLISAANPKGVEIKTAVIGFGKGFNSVPSYNKSLTIAENVGLIDASTASANQKNAAKWGVEGKGGWFSGNSSQDIVNSFNAFVQNVTTVIDPLATGSPTIPQDALNPLRIQPFGYYASFQPKPQEAYQLWLGNLNKYHIYNGELRDGTTSGSTRLITTDGTLNQSATGLWTGGMRGQLSLGIGDSDVANRKIFTNRQITGTATPYLASAATSLKQVNVNTLFGTGETALFVNDPDKNYWLNLLGYNVGAGETGITLTSLKTKPELRQLGAVMHSTPILLTQEGKITVDTNGNLDTTDRDDYLLFGSTQGLLHVVKAGRNSTDANRGKEVFTFVPHEMMQNQKRAFLTETSTTGGKDNLFYGIDAPWTAHTQYVAKTDGTLTVRVSGRTVKPSDDDEEIALKGLQWVYGGLRMGGRSYYALDLSDISGTTPNPLLKFHINPDAAVTTDEDGNTIPNTDNALSHMGQSWSKPTIAYVNFGGVKKLVMFVGGGYDARGATTACNTEGDTVAKNIGYECAKYNQSNGKGSGVYMFDANNGDLLWWASANATAAKGAEAFTDTSANTINMKYSVVSQINAIDRDSDGLVDHLYFGDLGGQAFRIDLNNAATGANVNAQKANFATRAVRLYNGNVNTGLSPRFYEMPSFSVHEGVDGAFGVAAFSSGNRSSPLASAANSANDAVYVIYDNDVARTDLYSTSSLTTQNVTLSNLTLNTGVAQTTGTGESRTYNGGWKYQYSNTVGRYKGMNELYALDNILYVNVFDRDGTGIGGTCGAGVYGDSYLYQFCLPTGKCSFYTDSTTVPNSVKLGAGILGAGLGQGFDNNANNTSLVVTRDDELDCTGANANKPECQKFNTTAKLRQLRWYETR